MIGFWGRASIVSPRLSGNTRASFLSFTPLRGLGGDIRKVGVEEEVQIISASLSDLEQISERQLSGRADQSRVKQRRNGEGTYA